MPIHTAYRTDFADFLAAASPRDPQLASEIVNRMLRLAKEVGASDIHINPSKDSLDVSWRLDGVLHPFVRVPVQLGPNVIARLKVLAGLLTYETARPQEGRIRDESLGVEVRVSTFPSLFGERAVLRMLGASDGVLAELAALGLPPGVFDELQRHLATTTGAVLIVGPAGSGKTTTAYACIRQIVARSAGGRSVASLEDPIEVALDGVAQSQVNLPAAFDMASGLRSLLRLDPEVILIGEMRDRATAEIALQAALTGQLVVTTFHAGNCAEAVRRLIDIGVASYAVRNAVRLIVAQRLVRRLCNCAQPADPNELAKPLGFNAVQCWTPGACDMCRGTGYRGRALIAEWRALDEGTLALLQPATSLSTRMPDAAINGDYQDFWSSAGALVEAGATSLQEVVRVLGFREVGDFA